MKIKIRNEPVLLDLLVIYVLVGILLAAIHLLPSNGLRIALGLPFLLFFPGYTLMAALFPKREKVGPIERTALSFGMSLAIVPLIGIILNNTPWGIRLEPILYSVTLFIVITSIIGGLRRRRLPEPERFGIEFQLKAPAWGGSASNRILSIILVAVILGVFGSLGYFIAKPKAETFTEFYILGLDGKAINYPTQVRAGEEGKIIAAIVNHEHEVVSYRIEVRIDEVKNNEAGPLVLANEKRWEGIVSFTPDKAGDNQKVAFFLYKNGEAEPCLKPLHLWIDVTE